MADLLDVLVPAVAVAVVRRLDIAELVREHIDLEGVLLEVDVDSVAGRLDVNSIAQHRLDADAVIQRLDLNEIVREEASTSTASWGRSTLTPRPPGWTSRR